MSELGKGILLSDLIASLRDWAAKGKASLASTKEQPTMWSDRGVLDKALGVVKRQLAGTITHVQTQEKVAALTFDDGPHSEYTAQLLDILQRHKAHATFFMVGESALRQPGLVRHVAESGHAIGNHTWDHPSLPSLPRSNRLRQIDACERVIAPHMRRLFRPPYGHQSLASRLDAMWLRYQVITWNVAAEDWLDHSANWMADLLAKSIRPGSIVLLHDAIYRSRQVVPQYDRREMLKAVNMLLERLDGRFRFITVPELLRQGRPVRQYWCDTKHDHRRWLKQLRMATQEMARLVPPGQIFILVDDNQWTLGESLAGRRRLPFLEREGQYWGSPPDDNNAIQEFERLRRSGANFIVFGWPAFWWLDYYSGLHHHILSKFRCVLQNKYLIVFDLRA